MTDHYVVFGNPIAHSKSPLIHRLFAEQTGQALDYQTALAPLDDFTAFAKQFFVSGLGANVTVPFKEEAYRLADQLTERGRRAEPVDIIINATSASLSGDVPPIAPSLIQPGETFCYDMMYAKEPTAFCRWATEHKAGQAVDGLGMLVEQAAEAFFLWRGV
nr:bifunctional 3-dehydroquinate dehydratase/shikimate dehydrogenase, chloroplastic-like [Tanacetum cinerariifolium]